MHSAGDGRLGCFQFGVIISHAAIPVNGPWYVCIQVSLGVYSGVKLLTDKHAYLQLLDIIKGLSKLVTVIRTPTNSAWEFYTFLNTWNCQRVFLNLVSHYFSWKYILWDLLY